jgi:hypothetical protein
MAFDEAFEQFCSAKGVEPIYPERYQAESGSRPGRNLTRLAIRGEHDRQMVCGVQGNCAAPVES